MRQEGEGEGGGREGGGGGEEDSDDEDEVRPPPHLCPQKSCTLGLRVQCYRGTSLIRNPPPRRTLQ